MDKLENRDFQRRYGTLYTNLFLRDGIIQLKSSTYWFVTIFCLKRMILAIATVYHGHQIWLNAAVYIYTSVFSLGFLLTQKPMADPALN
jgi:hypothetical protein